MPKLAVAALGQDVHDVSCAIASCFRQAAGWLCISSHESRSGPAARAGIWHALACAEAGAAVQASVPGAGAAAAAGSKARFGGQCPGGERPRAGEARSSVQHFVVCSLGS